MHNDGGNSMVENQEIQDLISDTDYIENCLLSNHSEYEVQLPIYIKKLSSVVTDIIVSYSYSDMSAYSEDAVYWSDLCRKILNAVNSLDTMLLIDILHFELRESLNMYLEIRKKTGI